MNVMNHDLNRLIGCAGRIRPLDNAVVELVRVALVA